MRRYADGEVPSCSIHRGRASPDRRSQFGASRYASQGRRKWRSQYRPNIRDASPDGQATRDNLTRIAGVEQRKTNEMIGAELGYRYVGSPVITDEPGGPEHLFRDYVPTTWPGARLPHVWLANGAPMQDLIGPGYTLLRLGGSKADPSALDRSMHATGAPFETLTVPEKWLVTSTATT